MAKQVNLLFFGEGREGVMVSVGSVCSDMIVSYWGQGLPLIVDPFLWSFAALTASTLVSSGCLGLLQNYVDTGASVIQTALCPLHAGIRST